MGKRWNYFLLGPNWEGPAAGAAALLYLYLNCSFGLENYAMFHPGISLSHRIADFTLWITCFLACRSAVLAIRRFWKAPPRNDPYTETLEEAFRERVRDESS